MDAQTRLLIRTFNSYVENLDSIIGTAMEKAWTDIAESHGEQVSEIAYEVGAYVIATYASEMSRELAYQLRKKTDADLGAIEINMEELKDEVQRNLKDHIQAQQRMKTGAKVEPRRSLVVPLRNKPQPGETATTAKKLIGRQA